MIRKLFLSIALLPLTVSAADYRLTSPDGGMSAEEYLAYTTEETEKVEVYRLVEQLGGDIEAAIRQLAERRRNKQ